MIRPGTPSFAKQCRIGAARGWLTPDGDMLAVEAGKVVTLKDGIPVEWDHIHQHSASGDNTDENIRPLTPVEHRAKTRADAKARAKVRRIRGETKAGPKAKIQSRGFSKTHRRKMSGEVVPR